MTDKAVQYGHAHLRYDRLDALPGCLHRKRLTCGVE
jgi:hypothetical protein